MVKLPLSLEGPLHNIEWLVVLRLIPIRIAVRNILSLRLSHETDKFFFAEPTMTVEVKENVERSMGRQVGDDESVEGSAMSECRADDECQKRTWRGRLCGSAP